MEKSRYVLFKPKASSGALLLPDTARQFRNCQLKYVDTKNADLAAALCTALV